MLGVGVAVGESGVDMVALVIMASNCNKQINIHLDYYFKALYNGNTVLI